MIILYTQPGCGKCEVLKKLMNRRGIFFTEKSAASPEIISMLQQNGFKSAPVMNADGKLVGFEEAVKALGKF
jgi:glutaredoxin